MRTVTVDIFGAVFFAATLTCAALHLITWTVAVLLIGSRFELNWRIR